MKFPKLSYRGYVRHVRRQNVHVQRMHAFVFAATITGLVAACLLYYDYGFWHDVYIQTDTQEVMTQEAVLASPTTPLVDFWGEVKTRFSAIGVTGMDFLESTDTITNDGTQTPSTP